MQRISISATEVTALAVLLKRSGGRITISLEELVNLNPRSSVEITQDFDSKQYILTLIGDSPDEKQVQRSTSNPPPLCHAPDEEQGECSSLEASRSAEGCPDLRPPV
jgi:hypothetical protein